jgi:cell shape-determining protein MreC
MKAAQDQAKDAVAKMEAAVSEATTAKIEAQTAKDQVAGLQKEIEESKQKVDELTKQIASTTTTGEGAPEAAPSDLEAKLKEVETKLAEQMAINQALEGRTRDAEGKAETLQQEKSRRDRQLIAKGLEGQVLAVNQAWNFVVLSIGDRQGVATNAEMIVKRGETMVGKIRITSVEPSTSIADVVPGSVRQGLRVLPGDTVIYAGS